MKTFLELLRSSAPLIEEKPKNDRHYSEKPKSVDPELQETWDDILRSAFTTVGQRVTSWKREYTRHQYLSPNFVAAHMGINALVTIYSDVYLSEFYQRSTEDYPRFLIELLNESMTEEKMQKADSLLQTALNNHPNKAMATTLNRDALKLAFHRMLRHQIILDAVIALDTATQTRFAPYLILDPQPKVEPKTRRGLFGKRS